MVDPITLKSRKLKHYINVLDTWKAMRKERMMKAKIGCHHGCTKKPENSFYRLIKSNDYEYGRKAVEKLSGIIKSDFNVLEIGAGPGSLTIPLAKKVNKIDSVEFSEKAIEQLKANLQEENLQNVEIIHQNWSTIDDEEIRDKYDLVVCSHFLWQMPDIKTLLTRMENASRSICAIIQPAGRDELTKEVFTEISGIEYTGQFEPDADYFAYVILREWGRLVQVASYDYIYERNLQEEVNYIAPFIGRFIDVDHEIKDKIKNCLLRKGKIESYIEKNNAVVMWW